MWLGWEWLFFAIRIRCLRRSLSIEREVRAGQLVAIPYGERLVEGIIWQLTGDSDDEGEAHARDGDKIALRPVSAILDLEPALLPHQRDLAEWMAAYYVTPLAQVAQSMLPPGLVQRSKVVLRLIGDEGQPGDVAG